MIDSEFHDQGVTATSSLQCKANAWDAVVNTLNLVIPGWRCLDTTDANNAIVAISNAVNESKKWNTFMKYSVPDWQCHFCDRDITAIRDTMNDIHPEWSTEFDGNLSDAVISKLHNESSIQLKLLYKHMENVYPSVVDRLEDGESDFNKLCKGIERIAYRARKYNAVDFGDVVFGRSIKEELDRSVPGWADYIQHNSMSSAGIAAIRELVSSEAYVTRQNALYHKKLARYKMFINNCYPHLKVDTSDWRPMNTAPRDGTVILLLWGDDGYSPGWWSYPVSPIQNSDGTWPSESDGFPWSFVDSNNGKYFVNSAVDTEYGPTHWKPYVDTSRNVSINSLLNMIYSKSGIGQKGTETDLEYVERVITQLYSDKVEANNKIVRLKELVNTYHTHISDLSKIMKEN